MTALAHEDRAQATVEMAIVAPVLIVLALIVFNIMIFVSATARFDRMAPDIVVAQGVSPDAAAGRGDADASEVIAEQMRDAMGGFDVEIEVSSSAGADKDASLLALVAAPRTYTCVMRYRVWPSALTIAGVDMAPPVKLTHERRVVIDPWRPGVVI